jgi:hypothetical protein
MIKSHQLKYHRLEGTAWCERICSFLCCPATMAFSGWRGQLR